MSDDSPDLPSPGWRDPNQDRPETTKMSHFEQELCNLINRHSMENGSDTPDFMLAEYLRGCLENFNRVVKKRSIWYGTATETIGELSKKLGLTGVLKDPQTPTGTNEN